MPPTPPARPDSTIGQIVSLPKPGTSGIDRLSSLRHRRFSGSVLAKHDDVFVFGIDFGTTYTGVAWAESSRQSADGIHLVKDWESEQYLNAEREKTPTTLSYVAGRTDIPWGYGIPLQAEKVQWFKLLLLDDEDIEEHLRNSPQLQTSRQMLEELGKTPLMAVADYLRCLWPHVLQSVAKATSIGLINQTPFRIIITVPAIWKSYMRERMREAANLAGLLHPRDCGPTELDFISEPEAAAIATFTKMRGRPDIEKGDTLTVVDAGGGTVDLISYEVINAEPFTVDEVVEGTGALCGAIFLDQEFKSLMEDLIGREIWNEIPKEEIETMMNQSWEHGIKQQFDGNEEGRKIWRVEMPRTADRLTGLPHVDIPSAHIKEIFDHVASQILDLVDQQIDRVESKTGSTPKFVILVGGFGKCKYLYERMSTYLKEVSEVIQPADPGPWTAICRGAVMRGTQDASVKISSRISRANYGHYFNPTWKEGVYDKRDLDICPMTDRPVAKNQVRWFLKRGESTTDKTPVHLKYYSVFLDSNPKGYPKMSDKLITCDLQNPPTRSEGSIKGLCTIEFTSPIPFHELKSETNSRGELVRYCYYQYLVSCDGGSLKIVVEAGGETVMSKNLSIDFETIRRPAQPTTATRAAVSSIPVAMKAPPRPATRRSVAKKPTIRKPAGIPSYNTEPVSSIPRPRTNSKLTVDQRPPLPMPPLPLMQRQPLERKTPNTNPKQSGLRGLFKKKQPPRPISPPNFQRVSSTEEPSYQAIMPPLMGPGPEKTLRPSSSIWDLPRFISPPPEVQRQKVGSFQSLVEMEANTGPTRSRRGGATPQAMATLSESDDHNWWERS